MHGAMVRGLTAHLLASLAVAAACCVLRGELLAEVRRRDIDEENSEEEKERELEWERGWRIAQALHPSLCWVFGWVKGYDLLDCDAVPSDASWVQPKLLLTYP